MWLFDRIRPVTPGDDRLVGYGSRPTPACCCSPASHRERHRGHHHNTQKEDQREVAFTARSCRSLSARSESSVSDHDWARDAKAASFSTGLTLGHWTR